MNLVQMRQKYEQGGYAQLSATARVCQDLILSKIAASLVKDNVAVKGGILMCSLSRNARRATQDIDLDFIRYSISDDSIRRFLQKLSEVDDVTVTVVGDIEELSQQDYKGKRTYIELSDGTNTFRTKLDLGVSTNLSDEQQECFFDVAHSDDGVYLLANPMEQIFAEKLTSLLKHGIRSTRFRDLYDMYYLGHRDDFDKGKFASYIDILVFGNPDMRESDMGTVLSRIERTVTNKDYLQRMKTSRRDWIGKSPEEVTNWLLQFLREFI